MDIVEKVAEAGAWLAGIGQEVRDGPRCRIVRNPDHPLIWDVNHLRLIRARNEGEIREMMAAARAALAHASHRVLHVDPLTPPAVEAWLAIEGYENDPMLQMVLSGPLLASPPDIDLRPVLDADDWQSFGAMLRDNFAETGPADSRDIAESVAAGLLAVARMKVPDFQFFIARIDGADCGYGAGGAGVNGLGVVDDIYTKPAFRKRGVATAVIAHAIDFARAGGAGDIVISAHAEETPKQLYASLGFRPVCVTRQYVKSVPRI